MVRNSRMSVQARLARPRLGWGARGSWARDIPCRDGQFLASGMVWPSVCAFETHALVVGLSQDLSGMVRFEWYVGFSYVVRRMACAQGVGGA
jgi:hypothetical protein